MRCRSHFPWDDPTEKHGYAFHCVCALLQTAARLRLRFCCRNPAQTGLGAGISPKGLALLGERPGCCGRRTAVLGMAGARILLVER
jgi:hypothetical protein